MKLLREPLSRNKQIAYGIVGVIGVALVWQLVLVTGIISKPGLPVPTDVVQEAVLLLGNGEFWTQIFYTLAEWLLGLVIAAVVGVILGGLMGAFPKVFIAFDLPVEVFRTLPSIAVGPILILLLGSGILPLALTVGLACVWPILLNTMYGVRSADSVAIQAGRVMGISPVGTFMSIKLPSALPFAFTGIRVAASIGLIVAVSAELLIGSGQGIGGFILLASAGADSLNTVYAATIIAGVLGVVINMVFVLLDNTVFAWKKGLSQ